MSLIPTPPDTPASPQETPPPENASPDFDEALRSLLGEHPELLQDVQQKGAAGMLQSLLGQVHLAQDASRQERERQSSGQDWSPAKAHAQLVVHLPGIASQLKWTAPDCLAALQCALSDDRMLPRYASMIVSLSRMMGKKPVTLLEQATDALPLPILSSPQMQQIESLMHPGWKQQQPDLALLVPASVHADRGTLAWRLDEQGKRLDAPAPMQLYCLPHRALSRLQSTLGLSLQAAWLDAQNSDPSHFQTLSERAQAGWRAWQQAWQTPQGLANKLLSWQTHWDSRVEVNAYMQQAAASHEQLSFLRGQLDGLLQALEGSYRNRISGLQYVTGLCASRPDDPEESPGIPASPDPAPASELTDNTSHPAPRPGP